MSYSQWFAGQVITAERLNGITATWTPWTPEWTTSNGTFIPSYGNAVVAGSYCVTGNMCTFRFEVTFGTTTNFNPGDTGDNWMFKLPVAAASTMGEMGHGSLQLNTQNRVYARVRGITTTHFGFEIASGPPSNDPIGGGLVDSLTPWTWAATYSVYATASYQIA